jgi:hypothetical protein
MIEIYTVLANLKSHKADGIACPRIDGYNNHINFEKGKGFLVNSVTALNSSTQESLPKNLWLLYQNMSLLKRLKMEFFVRSLERIPCPRCSSLKMKVIGSRKRKYITLKGNENILIIRRLRCQHCGGIHHELPDILVPYKRYSSECIETVISMNEPISVPADDSTLLRWRNWFSKISFHFLGCLQSISVQLYGYLKVAPTGQSVLHRIWHYVDSTYGWMARVVQPVANMNFWVHTRSAFMA